MTEQENAKCYEPKAASAPDAGQPAENASDKVLAWAHREHCMPLMSCGHPRKYETFGVPGANGCLACENAELREQLSPEITAAPSAPASAAREVCCLGSPHGTGIHRFLDGWQKHWPETIAGWLDFGDAFAAEQTRQLREELAERDRTILTQGHMITDGYKRESELHTKSPATIREKNLGARLEAIAKAAGHPWHSSRPIADTVQQLRQRAQAAETERDELQGEHGDMAMLLKAVVAKRGDIQCLRDKIIEYLTRKGLTSVAK